MIAVVRSKLTYSNVIATMALFIALGGVAVAATQLPRNSVGARQLKRGAVTSAKLAKKSVINGKLGPNSVGPGNIGNGAVTTAKLAGSSVIASTIKNGVITTNKLNNEAVTTPKLGKEAVATAKLGNESVTSAKLGKGSVTAAKLSDEIGPLLGTLKSGQTLRGVFDLGGVESARGAISYAFPLLNAAAVTVLKKGETSANCGGLGGGNQQTPQATGGNLCVYITESANLTTLEGENNTRLGFGLKGTGTGDVVAYGQWAVTAP
ncbi:MAG TPA: hypothetical protein VGN84_04695 [Solirubrobacterales bacterium]|jgi:hypothetical protein|nr:hypothetical protein [Solirubrobacterales bacterium]